MELFKLVGSIMVDSKEAQESISKTGEKSEGLLTKLGKGITTAAKWGAALAAGAAAAGAGIYKLATGTAQAADAIDKGSQAIGFSKEAYQQWDYVLSQSGSSIDSVGTWMQKLTNNIDDLGKGSSSAKEKFDRLGLSYDTLSSMSPEQQFETVIKTLQGVSDESERAALRNDLFGNSSKELAALLNTEADTVDGLKQKAKDLGMVMSDDAVGAGVKFTDALDTMKRSASGMMNSLGAEVLPMLTNVFTWVSDHMPVIRETVSGAIGTVTTVAGKAASFVQENIGKVQTVASTVWGAISTIFEAVKTAIGSVTASMDGAGMDWGNVWSGIQTAIQTAADVIAGIITILGEAIGWLVAEAQTDGTLINTVWNEIQSVIGNVLSVIQDLFSVFSAVFQGDWSAAWEGVRSIAATLWDMILSIVSNALETISSVVSTVMNAVGSFISSIWSGIQSTFSGALNTIQTTVSNVFETVKNAIITPLDTAKNTVSGIFDSIQTAISDKLNAAKDTVSGIIESIKGFFDFSWSLPKLKLPHISISGSFSLTPPSVPSFGIEWYKKAMDNAMLLDSPTIFGAMGNKLLGAGEAGPEVVAGADTLMQMIRTAVQGDASGIHVDNVYMSIYGAPGQSEEALAELIERRLTRKLRQEEAAL